MKQPHHILQRPVIRFRRWSRQHYAAFSSIGRNVSIGTLSKGIIEASIRKTSGILTISQNPLHSAPGNTSNSDTPPDPTDGNTPIGTAPCNALPKTAEPACQPPHHILKNTYRPYNTSVSTLKELRQSIPSTHHNKARISW